MVKNAIKKNVLKIVSSKNMIKVLDELKWKILQNSIKELPFPPPYVIKDIRESEQSYHEFSEDVWYWGDWSNEALLNGNLFAIEWIKVRPRYIKKYGKLIPNKVIDETNEFMDMLNKHQIPFEKYNDIFMIYGYKKIY